MLRSFASMEAGGLPPGSKNPAFRYAEEAEAEEKELILQIKLREEQLIPLQQAYDERAMRVPI